MAPSAANTILVPLLWTEGALLFLGLVVLFGHSSWLQLRRSGTAARRRLAHQELVAFLHRHDRGAVALPVFAALRRKEQLHCLVALAPSIKGDRAELLTGLAVRYGLVGWAEYRCLSRLWWRRLHAARLLSIIGGGRHWMVPLFADREAAVRAAAAEWAVGHPTPDVVEVLLPLLSDPAGICRFTAQDSLLRIGRAAVLPLAGYLRNASGPAAAAALKVAVGLADPRLLGPGLAFRSDPLPEVRREAARLLGAIGGELAVKALMDLVSDEDPSVRAAAARGLGVGERREAAPRLAGMLRDPSWDVRREAGLALRALGAPGSMYLRRALADQDRFAADMARQVMDMPESVGRVASS